MTGGQASDSETFGSRVRRLREDTGLTHSELGSLMCVHGQAVRYWESNRSHPRFTEYGKLADVLHTTVGYLLTGRAGG